MTSINIACGNSLIRKMSKKYNRMVIIPQLQVLSAIIFKISKKNFILYWSIAD